MHLSRVKLEPVSTPIQKAAQGAPTQNQLDALKEQRSALTSELTSLTVRRDLLHQQLANADPTSAAELQSQLRQIDARVKAVTNDMNRVDDAVHAIVMAGVPGGTSEPAPSGLGAGDLARMIQQSIAASIQPGVSTTSEARMHRMEQMVLGITALNGLGLVLMAVMLWRSIRLPRMTVARLSGDDTTQLESLQRGIDVIALEVERISESQRFLTKVVGTGKEPQRM